MSSEHKLVVRHDPKSPSAESIRSLRTNLQFVAVDQALKSIMVTSAGPAEGKTTIAANLAASMAEAGTKTILVGADLRKPSMHKVFNISNEIGLTNLLLGQARLSDVLIDSGIENLKLLSAGPVPPNPAELIGSDKMVECIREIQDACDFVIFDTTPAVAVTDAILLGRLVDGVLLVVAMNRTPRDVVLLAKQQLQHVGARVLGVVANRVRLRGSATLYYYYYGEPEVAATEETKTTPVRTFISRTLARLNGRG